MSASSRLTGQHCQTLLHLSKTWTKRTER